MGHAAYVEARSAAQSTRVRRLLTLINRLMQFG
jgi:hypothetical protein